MSEDILRTSFRTLFAGHTPPPIDQYIDSTPTPDPMATPAPAEEGLNEVDDTVIIKRNDSERADGESPARMDERASQNQTPAHFPLSTQEQLQAMARRRELAVCFKHQVEECRLALKYSVIGWTGTLDPVSRQCLLFPLCHLFLFSPGSYPLHAMLGLSLISQTYQFLPYLSHEP